MLSHPLIVEAAETLFVPVCVHNNTKDDDDARVLAAFKEPAWNNPVVRVLSHERQDLAARVTDDWSTAALVSAMVDALAASKLEVPTWLRMLHEEEQARRAGVERAVFTMT